MYVPLINFGKSLNLPPGYSYRRIDVIIQVDNQSSPFEFFTKKTKGKDFKPKKMLVPAYPKSTGNFPTPMCVDDNFDYIFGTNKKRTDSYLQKLDEAYAATKQGAILEVTKFVSNTQNKEYFLSEAKAIFSNKDLAQVNIRFQMNGEFITDIPSIQEWWSEKFLSIHETKVLHCQIDNVEKPCLIRPYNHKIKGIEGCLSTGGSLVSKDKDTFCSWGKTNNETSPVGLDNVVALYHALDYLTQTPRYEDRLKRDINHSIYLGKKSNSTCLVFCEDDAVTLKDYDKNNWLEIEDVDIEETAKETSYEEKVSQMFFQKTLDANGKDDVGWDVIKSKEFYILNVCSNGGRIAITEVNSLTVDQVQKNLYKFYSSQQYHSGIIPTSISALDRVINPGKQITAYGLRSQLWNLALLGRPLPDNLGYKILSRFKKAFYLPKEEWYVRKNLYKLLFLYMYGKENMESIAATMGKIACWIHIAECQYHADRNGGAFSTGTRTNVIKLLPGLFSNIHSIFPEIYQNYLSIYRPGGKHKLFKANKLISEAFAKHLTSDSEWYSVKPFTDQEKMDFACGFACAESIYFTKKDQANNEEE